jgi:two-component system, OmpR family, phosphate regulon sensor histidine kinase PhoR
VSNGSQKKPDQDQAEVKSRSEIKNPFACLLLDHLDTAAFCINAEGQFLYANRVFCDLLQLPAQEIESIALYDIEPNGSPALWQEQWKLLKQERSLLYPAHYQLKSGEILLARVKMRYLEYQSQELICASISADAAEVSPSKQDNSSPAAIVHIPVSEAKSELIPVICHQFRSLLNIISFSNSVIRRNLSRWTVDEKKPYLEHIQTAVDQITYLLDQSVLFGKLVTGTLHSRSAPIHLSSFCQELTEQLQSLLDANQQKIVFTTSEDDCTIDPFLLHTILTHLLSNAISYSIPDSTINLTILHHSQRLDVQIQDAGIGIPEPDQQRLFEPFYRGSNVGDRPGVGLGLAIVKQIVESQGGRIKLTSATNVGTKVSVTIPLAKEL